MSGLTDEALCVLTRQWHETTAELERLADQRKRLEAVLRDGIPHGRPVVASNGVRVQVVNGRVSVA